MPKAHHQNCLFCGDRNPRSFGLKFEPHQEGGIKTSFRGNEELQGYDGILHGGIIASLLDSAMTNCLFKKGIRAVTGDLKIRYRHSIPYDAEIEIQAQLTGSHPPLYRMKSHIAMGTKIMAHGEARFIKI